MKLFKRFDTYLLENYPSVWHSKIHLLVPFGLLLCLVFFLFGYIYTDEEIIKRHYTDRYFGDSYAALFHAILVLAGISLWAVLFFQKNAIRHLYPLKKAYFTQLFLLLFIGFYSLILPFHAFQGGVRSKMLSLVNIDEMKKEINEINLGLTFLPTNSSKYNYQNRSYPNPFPLNSMQYTNEEWATDLTPILFDSLGKKVFYEPRKHPENNTIMDGNVFQFYTLQRTLDDSCSRTYSELITKLYAFDSLDHLYTTSCYNYSYLEFEPDYFENKNPGIIHSYNQTFKLDYTYYDYDEYDEYSPLRNHNSKRIYDWMDKKQIDSIKGATKRFVEILKKYNITHFIETDTIVNYLAKHDFQFTKDGLVQTWNSDDSYIKEAQFELMKYGGFTGIMDSYQLSSPYSFDENEMQTIFSNAASAHINKIDWPAHALITILVFFLTMLLLLFEFTPFIQFLLAIPSGGVLIILNVLVGAAILEFRSSYNYHIEHIVATQIFVNVVLLFGVLFWFLKAKKFSKKIGGIFFNLCYMIVPGVPVAFIFLMDAWTQYRTILPCKDYESTVYTFWHYLYDPTLLLASGMLSLFLFLRLVKKFHAKPE